MKKSPAPVKNSVPNLLTINVEDFFQVGAFESLIKQERWSRFESRIQTNLEKVFELLDKYNHKATFFLFGWIADRYPEVVQEIIHRGQEIASRGYWHRGIREIPRQEFRDDLLKTQDALYRAGASNVIGYRSGLHSRTFEDCWAFEILMEEGFLYDSSFLPPLRGCPREPWRVLAHRYRSGDNYLWEFPISTITFSRWTIPIGGGNYFRQLPFFFIRNAAQQWHKNNSAPFVLYFHTWELDVDQPRVYSANFLTKIRQYRNLDKMKTVLEYFFSKHSFISCSEFLATVENEKIATEKNLKETTREIDLTYPADTIWEPVRNSAQDADKSLKDITIVIPCYNETTTIPYLANTLKSTTELLQKKYNVSFIFVDDYSSDTTYNSLIQFFGNRKDCTILRHERNKGVAAAIMTGIMQADSEVVCSMDCDCTYDPHEFINMIPVLADDIDLVTASPYHPQGRVIHVPTWRLFLSRTLSRMYSILLSRRLYTFTSCFRVYRKSTISKLQISNEGFLGIGEMIASSILSGLNVREYPATLESRIFGESKMKIVQTILQHLTLIFSLFLKKLTSNKIQTNSPSS